MKRQLFKIIVLLWIGWYAAGPAAEIFDHHSGPAHETHDILFNTGGGVTLVACALAFVVLQAKKLKEACSLPHHSERLAVLGALLSPTILRLNLSPTSIHSPPIPLRI